MIKRKNVSLIILALVLSSGIVFSQEKVDVDSLFLGMKSENRDFYMKMLKNMSEEHIHWRRDFHPEDKPSISLEEQNSKQFKDTQEKIEEKLNDLSSKLRSGLNPWFSPRYLGHMNSDVLMPAVLGYLSAILYNPNNVVFEAGPATCRMEIEVGKQLATMIGFDSEKTWGHITSGGTVANYEGLWVARNLKAAPLAIKETMPELVEGLSEWQLLNLSSEKTLDLIDEVVKNGKFNDLFKNSIRSKGLERNKLGKVLVPQSRHYSWDKACDVFGLGRDTLVHIPVKDDFRMSMKDLDKTIKKHLY